MIKYGLISKLDSFFLGKTMDLVVDNFNEDVINVTEIGIYSGATGSAIKQYFYYKNTPCYITGIDNNKDGEEVRFKYDNLIIGNSDEVAYKIPDESQHLIFEDSCHCFAHVISTFFCYAPKVKVGGYFAFHDTGKHIKPFKDFQHGDKENPDAYISVRKALESIGLIWKNGSNEFIDRYAEEWELVFDEADPNNEAGGICVFRKLY